MKLEDYEIYKIWKYQITSDIHVYDSVLFWQVLINDINKKNSTILDECFMIIEKLNPPESLIELIIPIIYRTLKEIEINNTETLIKKIINELPNILEYYKPLKTKVFDDEAESCVKMSEELIKYIKELRKNKLKRIVNEFKS